MTENTRYIVIFSQNSFTVLNCPSCPDINKISVKICHCFHNNKYKNIVKQKYLHIKLIKALFSRLCRNHTERIFSLRHSEKYFLVRCHQSCFFLTTLILLSTFNDKNTVRRETKGVFSFQWQSGYQSSGRNLIRSVIPPVLSLANFHIA